MWWVESVRDRLTWKGVSEGREGWAEGKGEGGLERGKGWRGWEDGERELCNSPRIFLNTLNPSASTSSARTYGKYPPSPALTGSLP